MVYMTERFSASLVSTLRLISVIMHWNDSLYSKTLHFIFGRWINPAHCCRNIDLADSQTLNGTCANFLSMYSTVDASISVSEFLCRTQDEFCQYTENSTVGMDEIHKACETTREGFSNKTLFLFQLFKPVIATEKQYQKWIVMVKSQVTMPQPYAVVFEIVKTADVNEYKLKFSFDNHIYEKEDVQNETQVIKKMLAKIIEHAEVSIGDVLASLRS
ncbi:hypothetical protein BDV41DRAFT_562216 [Aspergillus transmontanensis]|uniref:Condensation domain-containing protein n=1 Tax=Aspergillus transmontanensis TaxID=1034304 RepID=A0A5N6WB21_9EURO|nr:hypothetical protein BDV41DRAFT_562216 [Aspergillus transmontanensis]